MTQNYRNYTYSGGKYYRPRFAPINANSNKKRQCITCPEFKKMKKGINGSVRHDKRFTLGYCHSKNVYVYSEFNIDCPAYVDPIIAKKMEKILNGT